jgi:transcription elongation factor S-II
VEPSPLKKSRESAKGEDSKAATASSKSLKSSSTADLTKSSSSTGSSEAEQRARCREMLEEALATPPAPSSEGSRDIREVADGVETALFNAYEGLSKEYRARFRTLFLNLKNPKNSELRLRLRYGELAYDQLARMSSDELAPREVQEEKARIAKWQREAITRGVDKGSATDLFRCNKCQQRKCTYFQMQTRSADEPMTSFITCLNCGNRWKMN